MLLANNLPDIGNIFLGGHEIGEVANTQLIETTRDNGVFATLDSHYIIRIVGTA